MDLVIYPSGASSLYRGYLSGIAELVTSQLVQQIYLNSTRMRDMNLCSRRIKYIHINHQAVHVLLETVDAHEQGQAHHFVSKAQYVHIVDKIASYQRLDHV